MGGALPADFSPAGLVHAIALELDVDQLRAHHADPASAHLEVRRVLARHGITWQQGCVYFGAANVTSVACVLAAQDLARSLPWFAASARAVRMLRIEEMNDLMPAVRAASGAA
jgi:virulence-associated protein VapD